LILVDALFPLDGSRRREGKKNKIAMEEDGCPRAGHALLAVSQVTAVRCN
jgi:hypothetical protein